MASREQPTWCSHHTHIRTHLHVSRREHGQSDHEFLHVDLAGAGEGGGRLLAQCVMSVREKYNQRLPGIVADNVL